VYRHMRRPFLHAHCSASTSTCRTTSVANREFLDETECLQMRAIQECVECAYHIAAIVPPLHRHNTRHMIEDEEARGDINLALQLAKLVRGDRSSSCSCCRLPPGRPRRLLGLLLVGLDLHQQQHEQKRCPFFSDLPLLHGGHFGGQQQCVRRKPAGRVRQGRAAARTTARCVLLRQGA
jgi:hypothetical protein